MCRRNKMCCRGMECASGQCRRKIQLGLVGSLCVKDRDCNYGFCCARQNGQSVCKPLFQEGDKCSVPANGRRYLWSHECPCVYGLRCKRSKKRQLFYLFIGRRLQYLEMRSTTCFYTCVFIRLWLLLQSFKRTKLVTSNEGSLARMVIITIERRRCVVVMMRMVFT